MRKRLAIFGESSEVSKSVAGSGEKGFGGGRIKDDANIESLSFIEFGVGEIHCRLIVVGRHAGPWDVHGSGVGDGDDSDSARFVKGFPAFTDGLVVRRKRGGNVGRGASEVDGNLAVEVESGEFVEIFLRDMKAVADKNEGSGNGGRNVSQTRTEVGVGGEGKILGLAPIDKGEGRLGFFDAVLAEVDELVKPMSTAWLET